MEFVPRVLTRGTRPTKRGSLALGRIPIVSEAVYVLARRCGAAVAGIVEDVRDRTRRRRRKGGLNAATELQGRLVVSALDTALRCRLEHVVVETANRVEAVAQREMRS